MSGIIWNETAAFLTYVPFAYLFIVAFKNNLRYSMKTTMIILIVSVVMHLSMIYITKTTSSTAVVLYNYFELFMMLIFTIIIVKNSIWRVLFIGLVLKNTADTIVILAKFAEHLVSPAWADMGYNWSYSVSLAIFDLIMFPIVYKIINTYFTHEIRESISAFSWKFLWLVPFFFYLTWYYVFYYSSDKTDLEQACLPINSLFLLLSISCQYLIYVCLAKLVDSLHAEAALVEENHAIQLQALQYDYIIEQLENDRKIRHDFRHHITTISALAENNEIDHLKEYIAQYVSPMIWHSQIKYCSNTVLNLMASFYANKCSSNNINFYIELTVPSQLPLSENEITILFGNLLENAFDACMSLPEDEPRKITFLGKVINNVLVFSIENTFSNPVPQNFKDKIMSTKHEGSGIGIASCIDIVESHKGTIDFNSDKDFQVSIMFPM